MSASTAHIDLSAIVHNVVTLGVLAGDAAVCAVVKADGYGHGSVPVAEASLGAGAAMLAVAQVDEARVLRSAGVDAPLMILSEPRPDEIDVAIALGTQVVVYRPETIRAISERVAAVGARPVGVHLKIDTGMHRVGCRPDGALGLARLIADAVGVTHVGTMTHLARADEPDVPTTDEQLDGFTAVLDGLVAAGIDPGIRHAANSAGTIAFPASRLDMVRVGIACYGIAPSPALVGMVDLRPALRWTSTVSLVKTVSAGESVSYGHHHTFDRDTVVATVPVGYADGLPRRLGLAGGVVLIGGRRCPLVGVVTMDQVMVDCGPGASVVVGDEAVIIGSQGSERLSADDVASLVDTIGYEIVCGISGRVPRVHTS